MDRLACVDVPALPLQLLMKAHPEWAVLPAVVVDEDKPQGLVLWANKRAREAGVRPGARYGSALSLAPALRAGTIGREAIQAGVRAIVERLHGFSPDVEPSLSEPGVFWLDAGGLGPVFPSLRSWSLSMRQDLEGAGYVAAVVVGFRRFGTYAAARALKGRQAVVFDSLEVEDEAARGTALSLVGLSPGVLEALERLGVRRVGELLALPASGVRRRFGPEAHDLYRFASGAWEPPLNPMVLEVPLEVRLELDYHETNAERLVFIVKPLVDRLLHVLAERGQALVELRLKLVLDGAPAQELSIRTAAPTLSAVVVMELVQLRLAASPLAAPVVGLTAGAEAVSASAEQLAMFAEAPRRDPAAAARAFARLRAAFGSEDVVVKAVMRDRHSPEGSFAWEPMGAIAPPHPEASASPMLVRRILTKARPLPHPPGRGPDGLRVLGGERWSGPFRIVGGWWRTGMERDYYFAELATGELLWVFYDHARGCWFLQGEVG